MSSKNLFIENVSKSDIINGWHMDPAFSRTVLIQIADCNDEFATPKYKDDFLAIYRFKFDDTEDIFDMNSITTGQSIAIASILRDCLANGVNIIVHCFAGICRSGAVVEVAELIGFNKCEKARIPNTLVKRKIMDQLGISISQETSMFKGE